MNVKSISSAYLNFEGRTQRKNKKSEYVQQDNSFVHRAKRGARASAVGAALALATLSGGSGLTSCTDADAYSSSFSKAWCICDHNGNEIPNYPKNLGDSLVAQGKNIGVEIAPGCPDPDVYDNVVFLKSTAYNEFDYKKYETKVVRQGTKPNQLTLITKITDTSDPENPKVSFMKQVETNVPDEGIRLDKYVCNTRIEPDVDSKNWVKAGYEIRTNNRDWESNKVRIYDNNNKKLFDSEYRKGQLPNSFLYGTITYDPTTGEPNRDDDGNLCFVDYNFTKAKMWTTIAEYKEIPELDD